MLSHMTAVRTSKWNSSLARHFSLSWSPLLHSLRLIAQRPHLLRESLKDARFGLVKVTFESPLEATQPNLPRASILPLLDIMFRKRRGD